jgi:hypothetical protein
MQPLVYYAENDLFFLTSTILLDIDLLSFGVLKGLDLCLGGLPTLVGNTS